jgi:flavin reductase (DIM6/NTAB) family NADH-FMN oxidoreductase RutF
LVKKISLPLQAPESLSDEQARNWYRRRDFIIRPLVLITTINKQGVLNASVKTNFMTASSMKRYAFSCSPEHHTYQNIMETGEFVVNVTTEDIVAQVLKAAMTTEKPCPPHVNEIENAGLTPIPAEKVKPPRIKECVAHYECILEWCKHNIIVGKVVAASVDNTLMDGTDKRKPLVINAQGLHGYATVGKAKRWPSINI